MIYRFSVISDESDNFHLEVQADPAATFFDLHKAIAQAAHFPEGEMASFYICDRSWEKEKEVTLEPMDDDPEADSWVMRDTHIDELVDEEKQRLIYVFDYLTERGLYMELTKIITGKSMKGAKCTKMAGDPPRAAQGLDMGLQMSPSDSGKLFDEEYGIDEDDLGDLDLGDYEGEGPLSFNPYDDDRY